MSIIASIILVFMYRIILEQFKLYLLIYPKIKCDNNTSCFKKQTRTALKFAINVLHMNEYYIKTKFT